MKDIINNYNVELEKYKNKHAEIEAEKESVEARIERANKQLIKLEEKERKLHRPSRYDVIEALAKKLSEHYGLPYEIYGPFGLKCETSIYLRKDMSKTITAQKTISIRLRPFGDVENDWMTYDTGKRIDEFPKGSIGELNGYNSVYAPLPTDFNEILKLMTDDEMKKDWGTSSDVSLEKTINKAKHICETVNKGEVANPKIDLEI